MTWVSWVCDLSAVHMYVRRSGNSERLRWPSNCGRNSPEDDGLTGGRMSNMYGGWRSFPRGAVSTWQVVGIDSFLRVDCRLVPQKRDGYYLYTCCCIVMGGLLVVSSQPYGKVKSKESGSSEVVRTKGWTTASASSLGHLLGTAHARTES